MYQTSSALSDEPSPLSLDCKREEILHLVPSCTERTDGAGPIVDLGSDRGELFVITLGVNHVLENEWLTVSIWGSEDGAEWGSRPLAAFPNKCYCGIYSTFLDLANYSGIRFLQVRWSMVRWGKGDRGPMFGFYVSAQESVVAR